MPKTPDEHLAAKLARLLEYQQALTAFTRIAAESHTPERLMHHLAAQVSRLTHVGRVKVLRYRPDRGDLLIEAGVGWKPGVVGHAALSIDRFSPPGRALQTGAAVVIEDLPNSPEYRYSPLLREHGIVSVVNVPVQVEGRTWGVLEVDEDRPRSFDDGDVGFLTTVATVLGMALLRRETEQKIASTAEVHRRETVRAEMLLRELQHRIKNNFQIIISFLALQARRADAANRERFGRVMDRIHAIALAHDLLSMQEGASSVEFDTYLRALCASIDPQREEVTVEVDASPAILPLDRAVPIGLIVNELLTNALKHAFDDSGGVIRVAFTIEPDLGEGRVAIEDDGRGMGPAPDGGHGLSLVAAFAQQLQGRVERAQLERGTRTTIRFPLAV